MTNKFVILILAIAMLSCGSNDAYKYADKAEQSTKAKTTGEGQAEYKKTADAPGGAQIERKLIKKCKMTIEVDSYDKDRVKIVDLVKHFGGYIGGENETKYYYGIYNDIRIFVPKENFEILIDTIAGLAKFVDQKSVEAIDVTEEYIDNQARLKTKRELENRYLEILKKAKTIQEILEVEKQLNIIREEIEAKQGRLKYLDRRVAFSRISLNMYEKISGGTKITFGNKIINGFESGWKGLLNFIVGLATIWPLLIIIAVIIYIIRRYRLGRKKKIISNTVDK